MKRGSLFSIIFPLILLVLIQVQDSRQGARGGRQSSGSRRAPSSSTAQPSQPPRTPSQRTPQADRPERARGPSTPRPNTTSPDIPAPSTPHPSTPAPNISHGYHHIEASARSSHGQDPAGRAPGHAPGQAARISHNIPRSPSMSQTVTRPSQITTHPPRQHHAPSTTQPRPQGTREQRHFEQPHRMPSQGSLQSREQVKQFIHQSNVQRIQAPAAAPTHATPKFQSQLSHQTRSNIQAVTRVRAGVRQKHPQFNRWFGDSFFLEHHRQPFFHRSGANWWAAPTWTGVCNWLPWGWYNPVYYDDSGYGTTLPSEIESYSPAPTIESYPPAPTYEEEFAPPAPSEVQGYTTQAEGDWLPLGVFAAALNVANARYSDMFVQLAINRQGDIAGTYYNSSTDEAHDLDGAVEKETQEAIWKVSDKPESPIMTTGVYNLTQDVVPVQVHFPDESIQPWVLVRLSK